LDFSNWAADAAAPHKHVVLDFLRLGNMFGGLLYLNIT
jgi:hypothetical protein